MKEELVYITQDETGILSQDAYPDLSASYKSFTELYRYKVPIDRQIRFTPNNTFSLMAKKVSAPVGGAIAMDVTTPTDETAEANEATDNDMTLLPATPAVNDAYYYGYAFPFTSLVQGISTAGVGTWTVTWEYYNGSAWAALPGISDGTTAFTAAAGNKTVLWTRPRDWAQTAIDGRTMYWVRARVATYSAVTTQPLGDQAWINYTGTEIENTDLVKIEVRDSNELIRKAILSGATYKQVSEFTNSDLVCKLNVFEPVIANPNDWIVILVLAASPVDESQGYFILTGNMKRTSIF